MRPPDDHVAGAERRQAIVDTRAGYGVRCRGGGASTGSSLPRETSLRSRGKRRISTVTLLSSGCGPGWVSTGERVRTAGPRARRILRRRPARPTSPPATTKCKQQRAAHQDGEQPGRHARPGARTHMEVQAFHGWAMEEPLSEPAAPIERDCELDLRRRRFIIARLLTRHPTQHDACVAPCGLTSVADGVVAPKENKESACELRSTTTTFATRDLTSMHLRRGWSAAARTSFGFR